MWSINWGWLLQHPSEIVRLDEQLRLKEIALLNLNEKIGDNFNYVSEEVGNHLKLLHNFRCFLYIEGTKYFRACLLSKTEFSALKNRQPPQYFTENTPVNFSNWTENQLTLFLKVTCDKKNTENIFKKVIFRFLSQTCGGSTFPEKSAIADVIMSRCSFSIE
jgi:hypothetical protein